MQLVSVDIGGTHARFAIAEVENGRVVSLGEPVTLKTAEHASLQTAWQHFASIHGTPLPKAAALSVASPITGDIIRLTNNPWVIRPSLIPERLGADIYTVINDFGAVGHAVAQLPAEDFEHLCAPTGPARTGRDHRLRPGHRPRRRAGVQDQRSLPRPRHRRRPCRLCPARRDRGRFRQAPAPPVHPRVDRAHLLRPGIVAIYETLAALEGRAVPNLDDKAIWTEALDGTDSIALAALDRFCLSLGAVAGDLALAHGAKAVVIAGGLGLRIKDKLIRSGFDQRFVAKGRFQTLMAGIPVKLITHPQPGLFGAAAAFAQEHA